MVVERRWQRWLNLEGISRDAKDSSGITGPTKYDYCIGLG